MSEPQTLVDCLHRAAATNVGVRFLERDRERFMAYRELLERALRVGAGLSARGVGPGDRIGVAASTGPDFYHGFFGVLSCGATPVPLPLPPRFGRRADFDAAMASMLSAAGVRLVLTDASQQKPFRAHGATSVDEIDGAPTARPAPDPDDLALVQFSSGTTGPPKPIGLSHRQLLANVRAIQDAVLSAYPKEHGYEHGGVSWLPLYHDMGLVGSVLTALAHPAPLTLMPPEDFVARPARWLKAISRYRATISAAPHFAYELAAERILDEELRGVDLSSWLVALDGAEVVTPSILDRFYRRFHPFGLKLEALTPVYGLAEAALAVTFSELRAPFSWGSFDRRALLEDGLAIAAADGERLTSCGKPLPGFELRIAGREGEVLAEARVGRVLVRGPSITRGYLGQPEATAAVLQNGWLDTGDRGFVLAGELYLFGREKDLIVLRGRNFAPEVIERAVEGGGGVRRGSVAAVGILTDGGEGLCLLVERTPGLPWDDEVAAIDAIRARVVENLGVVPERVLLLDPGSLPRTSSGKIRRREAGRRFLSELTL